MLTFSPEVHSKITSGTAAITGSYVAGDAVIIENYNFVGFLFDYTKGTENETQLKIEVSDDGTNWYQQVTSATSGGTESLTLGVKEFNATGKYAFEVNPVKSKYIRSSIKAGTANGSAMIITTWGFV